MSELQFHNKIFYLGNGERPNLNECNCRVPCLFSFCSLDHSENVISLARIVRIVLNIPEGEEVAGILFAPRTGAP